VEVVMPTIAGQNLFSSGPSRLQLSAAGRVWLPPQTAFNTSDVAVDLAKRALRFEQTGRLVASSANALWSQMETIRARAEASLTGTLVSDSGQSWPDMTLVYFRPGEVVSRGRRWSVEYQVTYVRFEAP
jgi:hypothetical protein